jgi:hypothetical protein
LWTGQWEEAAGEVEGEEEPDQRKLLDELNHHGRQCDLYHHHDHFHVHHDH